MTLPGHDIHQNFILLLFMPTFRITPTEIILAMTEVPPPERKGRVMPVTGMMPIVIAMFSKIWNRNMAVKPTTMSAP